MFRDALGMLVTLPLPLPPGGTVSKMFAAADVHQVIHDSDFSATEVRAYAVTGHGRTEVSSSICGGGWSGWSNPHSGKTEP